MKILIIGSGGREHALAWKIRQSPLLGELFIAPGNGGTALEGRNVPIADNDIKGLTGFIKKEGVDLVVPGPELPLVLGIADACAEMGVPCFGPKAYAAQLEGSKIFSKRLMRETGVPTAEFEEFDDYGNALAYVKAMGAPIVIKADGLAAGKGVVVARSVEEAAEALDQMLVKKVFGKAGEKVVAEAALKGEEASFLAFCDDETVIPLPAAQDHKAAFDGDTGPNTGGMGAYSPAPILPESRYAEISDLAIRPILRGLKAKGHPFKGILYAGLMMTEQGPKVLEYNVRFGDPECQPLLMRLKGDLPDIMLACAQGRLAEKKLEHDPRPAICVVLAAKGYPGAYPKGMPIHGIERAEAVAPGKIKVFQAGTKLENGQTLANGGRILGITALGPDLAEAQKTAYAAVEQIRMEQGQFRRDIGNKGINHCWACGGAKV